MIIMVPSKAHANTIIYDTQNKMKISIYSSLKNFWTKLVINDYMYVAEVKLGAAGNETDVELLSSAAGGRNLTAVDSSGDVCTVTHSICGVDSCEPV